MVVENGFCLTTALLSCFDQIFRSIRATHELTGSFIQPVDSIPGWLTVADCKSPPRNKPRLASVLFRDSDCASIPPPFSSSQRFLPPVYESAGSSDNRRPRSCDRPNRPLGFGFCTRRVARSPVRDNPPR